ncbi:MAG: histidine phosphatase family protein, partial [Thermodesulfobacteriota bacterium]
MKNYYHIYQNFVVKPNGGLTSINLILVRHGLTRWNLEGLCQGFSDVELNQIGKKQIVELGESLVNEKISAVYSSDLQRATDTAKEIAKYHNLTVKVDPDFREMNQGDFEGLTFEEIRGSYSELLS